MNHYFPLNIMLYNFNREEETKSVNVEKQESVKLVSIQDFYEWAMINPKTVDFINIKNSLQNYLQVIHFNLVDYFKDYHDVTLDEKSIKELEQIVLENTKKLKEQ